jgi:hypothetical protein
MSVFKKEEIFKEFLKDPVLREKYKISEEELNEAEYGPESKHQILNFLQEFIENSLDDSYDITRRPGNFYKYLENKIK